MGFTCAVCGRWHDEEPRDVRMTYPEPVARLGEEARGRRVVASDDFCSLAGDGAASRHFARGLLELPVPDEGDSFRYGAWVELEADEVARLAALWRDPDGPGEPPFRGVLANELSPYVGTEGLPATLTLGAVERLPSLHVGGDHRLAADSRDGISVEHARALAAAVIHRES